MTEEDERLEHRTKSGWLLSARPLRWHDKLVLFLVGQAFARMLILVAMFGVSWMAVNAKQAWFGVVGWIAVSMLAWSYWVHYAHRSDR